MLLDASPAKRGRARSIQPIPDEPAASLHTLLLPGRDVREESDSFPAEYEDSYATDRAACLPDYRQAADCTDLIIDLT